MGLVITFKTDTYLDKEFFEEVSTSSEYVRLSFKPTDCDFLETVLAEWLRQVKDAKEFNHES